MGVDDVVAAAAAQSSPIERDAWAPKACSSTPRSSRARRAWRAPPLRQA